MAEDTLDLRARVRGMLLTGAAGDALGAPLEFLRREEIAKRWGPEGPETYVAGSWPPGSITDDTQMTLFTAEGIIRAVMRGREKGIGVPVHQVHHAYLRWLHTQGLPCPPIDSDPDLPDGWLVKQPFLHDPRAPGRTCIGALQAPFRGYGTPADNDSKGCGTVMRMAPAAIWDLAPYDFSAFTEGCLYGALTHAHPTGIIAGGYFARVLAMLLMGRPLRPAIEGALDDLEENAEAEETRRAVDSALRLADAAGPDPAVTSSLGGGWVAEEALAIGLFAALVAPDVRTGLRLAVNHSGDSDSTGSIAGNLFGAMHGDGALPPDLLAELEGRDVIQRVGNDLVRYVVEFQDELTDDDWMRYPGW